LRRARLTGGSPSRSPLRVWGDSTPRFREPLRGSQSRDVGPRNDCSDTPRRSGIVASAGAAATRSAEHCQRAAPGSRERVKRKARRHAARVRANGRCSARAVPTPPTSRPSIGDALARERAQPERHEYLDGLVRALAAYLLRLPGRAARRAPCASTGRMGRPRPRRSRPHDDAPQPAMALRLSDVYERIDFPPIPGSRL